MFRQIILLLYFLMLLSWTNSAIGQDALTGKQLAQYYMGQAVQELEKNNIREASNSYNMALNFDPDIVTKDPRLKELENILNEVVIEKDWMEELPENCIDKEKWTIAKIIRDCAVNHFNALGNPIHPKIIQEVSESLSGDDDQLIGSDILDSEGVQSRYSDRGLRRSDGGLGIYEESEEESREPFFAYTYVGQTDSGIHVLKTREGGGGTGVFYNLLLLKFIIVPGQYSFHKDTVSLKPSRPKLLLVNVGQFGLGDRWVGEIAVEGNDIYITHNSNWREPSMFIRELPIKSELDPVKLRVLDE